MAKRDISAEQRALGTYQGIYNKNPESSDDWTNLHKLAYPGGIPDELRESTGTTDPTSIDNIPRTDNPLPQSVGESNLDQLRSDVDTAKEGVDKMSQPNEALRILQESIREKSGIGEQPLGPSEVFKEAGLTGMGSLNASLNERSNKFKSDFTNFSNIVGQMSGQYQDMANMALQNYEMAYNEFTSEADRLQKIEDEAVSHARAIEKLRIQNENEKDLIDYERNYVPNNDIEGLLTPGAIGGQCGDYVHKIVDGVPPMGDTFQEKMSISNVDWNPDTTSPNFKVGDMLIQETNMPYGHVSVVTDVQGDKVTVVESNWGMDEKVGTRTLDINDESIKGAYRGGSLKEQKQRNLLETGEVKKGSVNAMKLEANGLEDAGREAQLDFLYGGKFGYEDEDGNPISKFEFAKEFISQNPDKTEEEITNYLRENTDGLTLTDINNLISEAKSDAPSQSAEEQQQSLKKSVESLNDKGFTEEEAKSLVKQKMLAAVSASMSTDGSKIEVSTLPEKHQKMLDDAISQVYGKKYEDRNFMGKLFNLSDRK